MATFPHTSQPLIEKFLQQPKPLPLKRPYALFLGESVDQCPSSPTSKRYRPEAVDDFVTWWVESESAEKDTAGRIVFLATQTATLSPEDVQSRRRIWHTDRMPLALLVVQVDHQKRALLRARCTGLRTWLRTISTCGLPANYTLIILPVSLMKYAGTVTLQVRL